MTIDFKTLKYLSSAVERGNDQVLIDYFNSFEGNNVYDKFISILKCWEYDVSYTLNLNLNDKPTKIPLNYVISEFKPLGNTEFPVIVDNCELMLDIPKTFDILVQQESIPLYSIINNVKISDKSINLIDLSIQDKHFIIDNLPAKLYMEFIKTVINNKKCVVTFENTLLKQLKFNFLTNEPLIFLKGLFTNFNSDYFKDVIYLLSRKIDGNLLLNSTPMEIEYYIEKYTAEMQTQNTGLQL